jgi:hypothetical protein
MNGNWFIDFGPTQGQQSAAPSGGAFFPAPPPQQALQILQNITSPIPVQEIPELDLSAQLLIFSALGIIVGTVFLGARFLRSSGGSKNISRRTMKTPTRSGSRRI